MSLRIVADETLRPWDWAITFEPTGSLVWTYSVTMARSTSSLRSSLMPPPFVSRVLCATILALIVPECQDYS